MLGLSDRARIIDLFDALMRGDAPAALAELEQQVGLGADPEVVVSDLAGFTHWTTKLKVSSKLADDAAVSQEERTAVWSLPASLPCRCWPAPGRCC
jgi:DNA polymerase-3 subunit gamma/tau